jgi:uncharacterized protein YcnI
MAGHYTKILMLTGTLLLGRAATCAAHITLATKEAAEGSYYLAVFDVPHGCSGSATTSISVDIPADIVTAKPQPKAGWTLTLTHEKLAEPVKRESGAMMTERVSNVSWSGGTLPDEEFDSFTILMHLPNRPGPLYFPTVQHCESGETRWIEMPPAGKTTRDVPHPPPYVTLIAPHAAVP